MAGVQKPISRLRATSVVDMSAGLTRKTALSSKIVQPQPVSRLQGEATTNPQRLARSLIDVQAAVSATNSTVRSDPQSQGGVYFRNVAVTGGTAIVLTHNLTRPYVGYIVTRVQGSNQITVRETALPTGLSPSISVSLMPSATGTIDVKVF